MSGSMCIVFEVGQAIRAMLLRTAVLCQKTASERSSRAVGGYRRFVDKRGKVRGLTVDARAASSFI